MLTFFFLKSYHFFSRIPDGNSTGQSATSATTVTKMPISSTLSWSCPTERNIFIEFPKKKNFSAITRITTTRFRARWVCSWSTKSWRAASIPIWKASSRIFSRYGNFDSNLKITREHQKDIRNRLGKSGRYILYIFFSRIPTIFENLISYIQKI